MYMCCFFYLSGVALGSLTHDDVAQGYSAFFKNAERRLQRKLGKITEVTEEMYSHVPKEAFEVCHQ